MLIAKGYEATGLDSDLYRACDYGWATLPEPDIVKDIRDVVPADLEGFDAVIHLAGLSNDPLGDIDPDLTRAINTDATIRLAEIAKAAGVQRFLFSSSCSNYGAAGQEWLTEDSPMNPVTPYAVSKVVCEEQLDRLADADFSPVFLRSGTAYGMSPRIRFDLVANNLTAWAVATGQVRLKSDGSAWRPLVHAEDMASAFLAVLQADRDLVHREAFNVGRNEDSIQIRDLAEIVNAVVPNSQITFSPARVVDVRSYRVDCSKIQRIGFCPQWTVQRGVAELREAFVKLGVSVTDFEGTRYQRVAHIQHLIQAGELDAMLRRTSAIAA